MTAETEIDFLSLWPIKPKNIYSKYSNICMTIHILELFYEFQVRYSIYKTTNYIKRQTKPK